MGKIAVVYWSGTGNTEIMADEVVAGAKEAGAEVSLFTAGQFHGDKMEEFDAWLLDARLWETRNWKTQSLHLCFQAVR